MTQGLPTLPLAALAERWRGRERFVVLLDTAGDAGGFIALWRHWQADPSRCERLDVVAFGAPDAPPPALPEPGAALQDPVRQLRAQWPVATPDLHRLTFDAGRVQLLLALGDRRRQWREVVAAVDAFVVDADGADGPSLSKAIMRLAAPSAVVWATGAGTPVLAALRARGFDDILTDGGVTTAIYRPRFTPSRAAVRDPSPASPATRHALVIGCGLAGAATAAALARQGWRTTVLDAAEGPARAASGNPAGLFHGIVNPDDGPHARFNRVASFHAARAIGLALSEQAVAGSDRGLLRLGGADASLAAMTSLLQRLPLPPGYVEALDAAEATRRAGVPIAQPAWWYAQGGWVDPAGFVEAMLANAGAHCALQTGQHVDRLARDGDLWLALDRAGREIVRSEVVVLANAGDAARLVDGLPTGPCRWPLRAVRGQLTVLDWLPGEPAPQVPIAGGGYVMPPRDGQLVFGATAQPGDLDPTVRIDDHHHNLDRLKRLLDPASVDRAVAASTSLGGRTAWRCVSDDRLPLIGQVPAPWGADEVSPAQARFVRRQPGLYVLAGLGSRGITWCTLGGEVLAAAIAGGPSPLSASLHDAVDPARFMTRAIRHREVSGRSPRG